MKHIFLPILVSAICLFKSAGQMVIFVLNPEMLEKTPPLILLLSGVIVISHGVAAYLALTRAFLAFLVLAVVVVVHASFFPLGVALSSEIALSRNYWDGFWISVLSHVLLALLAYASWRYSRRPNKVCSSLEPD